MSDYNPQLNKTAEEILDGVILIAEREMLVQEVYVSRYVVDENLAEEGAICGGHQACLFGSLWLAAGIKIPEIDNDTRVMDISRGMRVEPEQRSDVYEELPELKRAAEALNAEAVLRIDYTHRDRERDRFDDPAEEYFEHTLEGLEDDQIQQRVIELCEAAKKRLKEAA